jgi:membrane associated rhomboid family serine protease
VSRYPSSSISYALGPGPPSPAVRVLLIVNVAAWLINIVVPQITEGLGLSPAAVFERLSIWQLVTYMFLHDISGFGHLLFNMLALWMFGTDLERTWRTRFFVKYYFVCGIGAGFTTLALALINGQLYNTITVGASGAIYGLLLAYGLYFPSRTIFFLIFPLPARVFVMIVGAIAFVSSMGGPGGGVAHTAHLGGLLVGYLYLKGLRVRPFDELKYRWLKWRMSRARGRFNVYSGGRKEDDWKQDWKKHIH